jgi:hypothetical protein
MIGNLKSISYLVSVPKRLVNAIAERVTPMLRGARYGEKNNVRAWENLFPSLKNVIAKRGALKI